MKWLVVGALGAVVDYGVLIPLVEFARVDPPLAQAVSFSAAVVNNYIWNRRWTFGDLRHKRAAVQFMQFTAVSVIGLAVRTASVVLLYQGFSLRFLRFGYILATAIAIVIVLAWNFLVNRYWTFREQSDSPLRGS
jgi:putative flippase GtrA